MVEPAHSQTPAFAFSKSYTGTPSDDPVELRIPARDGFSLAATLYGPQPARSLVVINSATAVPRRFYRHFAAALVARGHTVLTWDYRGIGGSRPASLRGFSARMRDWVLLDMEGVLDWARAQAPERLQLVGHSAGGQLPGLLANPEGIAGMLTFSSQSGYWRLQGGEQKLAVGLHMHLTLPVSAAVFGYMPWRKFGGDEDLPQGVAREWARWCRSRNYLLDDATLPLDRFRRFTAPVLAYSIADDKWGTAAAVDAMMRAYPNVERRHIPVEAGRIGHFGLFRASSSALWQAPLDWLDRV